MLAVLAATPAAAKPCPVMERLSRMPAASRRLSDKDSARAAQPRPDKSSAVHGATPADAFAGMNKVLLADAVRTAPCESFDHPSLNSVASVLYKLREADLDAGYKGKKDRRALHFESFDYKETLWKAEEHAATTLASHAPGSLNYNATRDGKCAEAVMWYIHHLSEGERERLAQIEAFALPLMPHDVSPVKARAHEYDQQIGCTSCHVAVHVPGTPPITPIPDKNSTEPQYPVTCPIDSSTGKPKVWYNRTKRCDWDYVPFCSPCEGVGGMTWGNNDDEWNPMPCEVVMQPDDIPAENLTSPLWPKNFTVYEYAHLTFPGRDPCDVSFRNSTYNLLFQTAEDGSPTYHTIGLTGPSGPSPFPGKSWGLPNGNFYTTVDVAGRSTFCTCLGQVDPVVDNALTGPLSWDFNKGAKLVGRERVVPEYYDGRSVVADHWVKGPHHFWIEVATNLMIREWQPFNGLQTYLNWNVSAPDPNLMAVESICYSGLLHVNISCKFPAPNQ